MSTPEPSQLETDETPKRARRKPVFLPAILAVFLAGGYFGWKGMSSAEPTPSLFIPATANGNQNVEESNSSPRVVANSVGKSNPVITDSNVTPASASVTLTSDERIREQLLGTWEQQRYGKRLLTVKPDGTATMVVEPDTGWSLLFGDKLHFNIAWTLKDSRLTFETVGGTPKDSIDLFSKMFGTKQTRPIQTLDDKQLVLFDEKDKQPRNWKRYVPKD